MFKKFLVAASAVVSLGFGGFLAAGTANAASLTPQVSGTVVNSTSGKCLDNKNFDWTRGNPLQQWTCGASGGADQNFRLADVKDVQVLEAVQSTADGNVYWYVSSQPGGSSSKDSRNLFITDTFNKADEQVTLESASNGVFYAFPGTDLVMDNKSFSHANGTEVIGYPLNNGTNQMWSALGKSVKPVPVLAVTSTQSFTDTAGGLSSTGSNPLVITNAGDGPSDADMSAQVNYTVTVEDVSLVPVSDVNASLSDELSVSGTDSGNHDFSVTTTVDLTATPADQSLSGHDGDVFSASLGESQLEAASYTITDNGVTHTGQSFSAVESVLNGATVSSASAVATPDVTATFDHGHSVAVADYTPAALTASYGVLPVIRPLSK